MSACLQAVCPLNRVVCFSGRRVLGGCRRAWRNTGSNCLGTRRSVSSTAWSSGFPAPCGCPALRLPLGESDLATAQKQGSVPVSQEVETSSRGSGRLSGHPGVRFEQAGEQLGGWLSR